MPISAQHLKQDQQIHRKINSVPRERLRLVAIFALGCVMLVFWIGVMLADVVDAVRSISSDGVDAEETEQKEGDDDSSS